MNNKTTTDLAPIALFVYKRPEHTLQTLKGLASNPEFIDSPLYIYCDGVKNPDHIKNMNDTRSIVKNWPHPNKTIIEQEKNQGLAKSIINGVSDLLKKYNSIIVVEDDLIVSNSFLHYLNSSLKIYRDSPKVMQVSAYMFPISEFENEKEALFLSFISSWGWATWDRAWQHFDAKSEGWEILLKDKKIRNAFDINGNYDYSDMLFQQIQGKIDSWAIRWNWSVFKEKGLVLYPPNSLVINIGFDGTGTHCRTNSFYKENHFLNPPIMEYPDQIEVNEDRKKIIQEKIKQMTGTNIKRTLKFFQSMIRRLALNISKDQNKR